MIRSLYFSEFYGNLISLDRRLVATLFKTLIWDKFGGQFTKNYGTQQNTNSPAMYINSNLVSKTLKGEQAALIKQIFTVLTLRFIRIPFEFTCDSSLLQTNVRVPSAASNAIKLFLLQTELSACLNQRIEVKCMGRLTNISWQRFV